MNPGIYYARTIANMYTEDCEQPIEFDVFRYVDKSIKSFYKRINARDKLTKSNGKLPKSVEASDFDWSDVIDPRNLSDEQATVTHTTIDFEDVTGSSIVKVIRLKDGPCGLYVIPNLLSPELQLYWARKALAKYSLEEYTNLTNLGRTTEEIATWIDASSGVKDFQEFLKLRWSCLGYHYDWTARKYQKNLKSEFPSDFATLCKKIAQLIQYDFQPEAAIVNYYPLSASMGGHLDDAEHTMEKPIVSISLGCSAIFLMGGTTKNIKPIPVLVRSGDVVIMTEESRRCYHGVPCIFPPSFSCLVDQNKALNIDNSESFLCPGSANYHALPKDDQRVVDFLNEARINMNVRQVRVNAHINTSCSSSNVNDAERADSGVSGEDDDDWVDKAGTGHVKLPSVVVKTV